MVHVTFVKSPAGSRVNSLILWASNGFTKSTSTAITLGGSDSIIDIRPLPALPWLSHSETAPLPLSVPLYVLFIVGSSLSWGAQLLQLWKSFMSTKILSGGVLTFIVR